MNRRFSYLMSALIIVVAFLVIKNQIKYKTSIINYFKPVIRVKLTNLAHYGIPGAILGILNERYSVQETDQDYDIIVDSVYGKIDQGVYTTESIKDDKAIKIFWTAEAALPNLDDYDLVLGFNRIDSPKYVRYPYYLGRDIKVSNNMRAHMGSCNAHKPVFACFLVSNGMRGNNPYAGNGKPMDGVVARDKMFEKLSAYKKVESGGKHLNNIDKIIPGEETKQWFSKCKFVIAFENQSYDGYITEKPFQAYFAGSIPLYYSSKDAVKDLNKKAVIYAGDFKNQDEMVEYIKKVDNDDKLYCDIWNQNIITDPQLNYENVKEELRIKLFRLLDERLGK